MLLTSDLAIVSKVSASSFMFPSVATIETAYNRSQIKGHDWLALESWAALLIQRCGRIISNSTYQQLVRDGFAIHPLGVDCTQLQRTRQRSALEGRDR